MDNDYISRESFRKNIADILNDETYIAAAIEQYLDEEPSVDIKWKDELGKVRAVNIEHITGNLDVPAKISAFVK